MKFKELLDQNKDRKIIKRLFKLYPDQKKNLIGYEKALVELRKTQPKESNIEIEIQHYTEDEFGYSSFDSVSGLGEPWDDEYVQDIPIEQRRRDYGIEFTKWNEWLGMDVSKFTLDHYCKLDILAHCLWEMTWSGYSNKSVQKKIKSIYGRIKDIDKKLL